MREAAHIRDRHLAMRAAGDAPPWLAERQDRALERFLLQGFPSLKHEDWRYTNLRALREAPFEVGTGAAAVHDVALDGVRLAVDPARVAVTADLPAGVTALSLRDALAQGHDLAKRLGETAGDGAALTAFNDAFAQDALLLHVARGSEIERPLIVDWQLPTGEFALSSPRLLVVADANSQITVVENRVGRGGFCNGVSELILDAGARLRHVDLKREKNTCHSIARIAARLGRDARLDALSVALGGKLVRNDVAVTLAERGAQAALRGVFAAAADNHIDNHTLLDHVSGDTHSEEDYRGIIGRLGHGVFNGKVIVREDAQKISSAQSNDNLLLDDSAEIDTKPELQIYADDVRCSHGATIGRLDEQALFYLRSRGVDQDSARRMLLDAFAARAIAGFPDAGLRRSLTALVTDYLARTVLEETP